MTDLDNGNVKLDLTRKQATILSILLCETRRQLTSRIESLRSAGVVAHDSIEHRSQVEDLIQTLDSARDAVQYNV